MKAGEDDAVLFVKNAWAFNNRISEVYLVSVAQDLASLYNRLGRTDEEMVVLKEAWETRRRGNSVDLLLVAHDLAALYNRLGRTDEELVVLNSIRSAGSDG